MKWDRERAFFVAGLHGSIYEEYNFLLMALNVSLLHSCNPHTKRADFVLNTCFRFNRLNPLLCYLSWPRFKEVSLGGMMASWFVFARGEDDVVFECSFLDTKLLPPHRRTIFYSMRWPTWYRYAWLNHLMPVVLISFYDDIGGREPHFWDCIGTRKEVGPSATHDIFF